MSVAAGAAQAVAMVGLTVGDMDRSVDFYTSVLRFREGVGRRGGGERLRAAGGRLRRPDAGRAPEARRRALELTEYLAPGAGPFRPTPAATTAGSSTSRSSSATWTAPSPPPAEQGAARLDRPAAPARRTIPNAAGIRAFYFRDPDGHPLEILQFPPDKGDPKWHAPSDRLFLGIDHTAIVVSDTDASLEFYRDVLGFRSPARARTSAPSRST